VAAAACSEDFGKELKVVGMKLTFYRGAVPNFGDELNIMMWRSLFPDGFFDDNDDELFLGIGSILFDDYPPAAEKFVAGSGYGGYTAPPDVKDGTWRILWVRGPYSADRLKIDRCHVITDAAVLLRAVALPPAATGVDVAFMPHVDSMMRGNWAEVCRLAGVTFIDPSDPVGKTIATIRGARLLITEAMHGAIVADALRTPWVPILPFHKTHREKWLDWAASLSIDLDRSTLPPTSLAELWAKLSGRQAVAGKSRKYLAGGPSEPINSLLRQVAAASLVRLSERAGPHLSDDRLLEAATSRALEVVDSFAWERAGAAVRVSVSGTH
jgi:succinoglycan biosynthesis protein ExoV